MKQTVKTSLEKLYLIPNSAVFKYFFEILTPEIKITKKTDHPREKTGWKDKKEVIKTTVFKGGILCHQIHASKKAFDFFWHSIYLWHKAVLLHSVNCRLVCGEIPGSNNSDELPTLLTKQSFTESIKPHLLLFYGLRDVIIIFFIQWKFWAVTISSSLSAVRFRAR